MVGDGFVLNSFVLFNILLEAGITGDKTSHSSHINLIQSMELHSIDFAPQNPPSPAPTSTGKPHGRADPQEKKTTQRHLNKQIKKIIPQSQDRKSVV